MDNRFLREEMLLGSAAMERLRGSSVAVVGLGGVGSWCAEALARSGVGRMTVMDEDTVSLTNVNRQSIALSSTIGRSKAEVMGARIRDIAPECDVTVLPERYEAAQRPGIPRLGHGHRRDAPLPVRHYRAARIACAKAPQADACGTFFVHQIILRS